MFHYEGEFWGEYGVTCTREWIFLDVSFPEEFLTVMIFHLFDLSHENQVITKPYRTWNRKLLYFFVSWCKKITKWMVWGTSELKSNIPSHRYRLNYTSIRWYALLLFIDKYTYLHSFFLIKASEQHESYRFYVVFLQNVMFIYNQIYSHLIVFHIISTWFIGHHKNKNWSYA